MLFKMKSSPQLMQLDFWTRFTGDLGYYGEPNLYKYIFRGFRSMEGSGWVQKD